MNLRSALTLAVLVLIAAFVALNWTSFTTPTSLDFLVARIEAPLGIVMLMLVGAVIVVYMLAVAKAEVSGLIESRRIHKELERLRQLAESAELSRTRELKELIVAEIGALRAELLQLRTELGRPALPAAAREVRQEMLPR